MANAYTKIQIHIVFSVRFRYALIEPAWEEELYKYITGIVQKRGHKMLAINGMPDHLHIFIGYKPVEDLSALVREIKKAATEFIKTIYKPRVNFHWQEGYGAFSYSEDQVKIIVNYILNQKEHHRKVLFKDEYKQLLRDFNVEFDEKYVFKRPE